MQHLIGKYRQNRDRTAKQYGEHIKRHDGKQHLIAHHKPPSQRQCFLGPVRGYPDF